MNFSFKLDSDKRFYPRINYTRKAQSGSQILGTFEEGVPTFSCIIVVFAQLSLSFDRYERFIEFFLSVVLVWMDNDVYVNNIIQ